MVVPKAGIHNTQITIAPSVDKEWIVIWITVVDQIWFGRTKIEYDFARTGAKSYLMFVYGNQTWQRM